MQIPTITDYEIHDLLGDGATGTVYRGTYNGVTECAIKVLKGKSVNRQLMAGSISRLQASPPHPGILEVYQAELVQAPYFYSMPLLADDVNGEWRGRTLATVMGALPVEETWAIIESMAEALGHAHRHGVSNCNIKPSNILLTGDPGNPIKVSDFAQGWIGGIQEIEIEDELFYAPPEQIEHPERFHNEHSRRWDVYSFGVLAFRLLTGQFPRSSTYINELEKDYAEEGAAVLDPGEFIRHLHAAPAVVWGDAGAANEHETRKREILERCLALSPGDRPSDLRDVAAEFRSIRTEQLFQRDVEGIQREAQIEQDRTARTARQWRKRFSVLIVLGFVLLGGVAGLGVAAYMGKVPWLSNAVSGKNTGAGDEKEPARQAPVVDPENDRLAEELRQQVAEAEQKAERARKASEAAIAKLKASRAVAALFVEELLSESDPARLEERVTGLRQAEEYYGQLAADLENDPSKAREMAGVQTTLGRINLALDNETGAMEGFLAARTALESVLNENPGDVEARAAIMEIGMRLVTLQAGSGRYQEALHSIEDCEERGRTALKSDSPPAGARRMLAEVLSEKAGIARALGKTDEALKAGAEAITELKSLVEAEGSTDDDREALAVSYIAEAEILRDTGRMELAMDYLMPAAGLLVELAEEGERVTSRFELGRCYEAMAGILSRIGEAKDATDAADAAQQLFRNLQKDDPATPINRYFLAKTLGHLARLGRDGGKLDEAIKQQQESVDILSGLTTDYPANRIFELQFGLEKARLGVLLGNLPKNVRKKESLRFATEAAEVLETFLAKDATLDLTSPLVRQCYLGLAEAEGYLGHVSENDKDPAKAKLHFEKAEQRWQALAAHYPQDSVVKDGLALIQHRLKQLEK